MDRRDQSDRARPAEFGTRLVGTSVRVRNLESTQSSAERKAAFANAIDETGRLRMLSHRGVMQLSLAFLAEDGERRTALIADVRKSVQAFERQVQVLKDSRSSGVNSTDFAILRDLLFGSKTRFVDRLQHYGIEISRLTSQLEREGSIDRPDLNKLADFVSGALLECVNELVAALRSDLAALEKVDRDHMRKAAESVDSAATAIKSLGDQVRLISLNAKIEASRAGDAGRGFGVISTEVKTLSDHVQTFANEISANAESLKCFV
ncbi:MAG: methyl-accepting chemotaxis protein [Geminicoccaceae bacterium]